MSGKRENVPLIIASLAAVLVLSACGSASPTRSGASPLSPLASNGASSAGSPAGSSSPAHPTPSTGRPAPTATRKPAGTPPASGTRASKPAVVTPLPIALRHVFPVIGTVGYAHTHHDYPATDIITACGNTVRAATSGVILEVTRVDTWKANVNAGATRGGLSVSIKGDDGIRYYGSHLEKINTNIQPGVRVTVGETLGKVGRTGDAGACHLHFGLSPVCKGVGDWWIQRGVVYPWPYLDSWRNGGRKSPVAAVNAWQKKFGCPTKPLVDP